MDRPLGFFTLVSVVIHALIIFLIPIWSWQGPVKLYPVEYGKVTDLYEAPASHPAGLVRPSAAKAPEIAAKPPAPAPQPKPKPKPEAPPRITPKPETKATEAIVASKPKPPEAVKSSQDKDNTRVITAKEEGPEKLPAAAAEPKAKPPKEAAPVSEETKETKRDAPAEGGTPGGTEGQKAAEDVNPGQGIEDYGTGESLVVSGHPPVYPKGAQNEGVEGEVWLKAEVDRDGNLTGVAVTRSSGDGRLDGIARVTLERGWAFRPLGRDYSLIVIVAFHKNEVTVRFGGVEFPKGSGGR